MMRKENWIAVESADDEKFGVALRALKIGKKISVYMKHA